MKNQFFFFILFALAVCKIQQQSSFYPFSAPIAFGGVSFQTASNHIVILTDKPSANLQMYDFDTNKTINLSQISFNAQTSRYWVITSQANTPDKYCFIVEDINTRTGTIISNNSNACNNGNVIHNTTGFNGSSSFLFNDQATHLYYGNIRYSPRNNGSFISFYWNKGLSQYQTLSGKGFVMNGAPLYNNKSIYFKTRNQPFNGNDYILVFQDNRQGHAPQLVQNFTIANPYKLDVHGQYIAIGRNETIQIRRSYGKYEILYTMNISSLHKKFIIVGEYLVVQYDNFMEQFRLSDGLRIARFDYDFTAPSTSLNRVGYGKKLLIATLNNFSLFLLNEIIACQGPCKCPPQYTQVGQQCVLTSTLPAQCKTPSLIGNALAFISIRLVSKQFLPILMFLEQFWLYYFYKGANYTENIAIFMQEIDFVNQLILKPDFLNLFSNWMSNYTIWHENAYKNSYSTSSLNIQTLYFASSIKKDLISSNLLVIVTFLFFRVIWCFVSKISTQKSKINLLLRNFIQQRAYCWILLISIVEKNFRGLCYYSMNQISVSNFYSIENKITIVAAILMFSLLVLYSLTAYPLLYKFYGKKAQCIIVFCKKTEMNSYYLQNALFITVKLLKTFPHSALFETMSYRFIILLIIDLCLLVLIIVLKKKFTNHFTFLVCLLYQLLICFVNSIFLYNADIYGNYYIRVDLFCGLLIVILAISILMALYSIFTQTKDMKDSLSQKKKDENQNKQKRKQNQKPNLQAIENAANTREEMPNEIPPCINQNAKLNFNQNQNQLYKNPVITNNRRKNVIQRVRQNKALHIKTIRMRRQSQQN